MKKRIFCKIIVLTLSSLLVQAQSWVVGGGTTLSSYFGDLAPYNLKQSWASVHPGIGLYASKRVAGPLYFGLDFEQSTISADDKKSASLSRKIRNLSFRSPITALSGIVGFRIGLIRRSAFGIVGGMGLTGFLYDPMAKIDGKWHKLHNLSTEGQGLPGGPEPYNLFQVAIPVQAGLFFRMGKGFYLDVQLTHYFTSTDYLDDVSTNAYYDPEILRQERGELAFRLADRTKEAFPDRNSGFVQGLVRGNPRKNDEFLFFKVGVSWGYGKKKNLYTKGSKIKCPEVNKKWFEDASTKYSKSRK